MRKDSRGQPGGEVDLKVESSTSRVLKMYTFTTSLCHTVSRYHTWIIISARGLILR